MCESPGPDGTAPAGGPSTAPASWQELSTSPEGGMSPPLWDGGQEGTVPMARSPYGEPQAFEYEASPCSGYLQVGASPSPHASHSRRSTAPNTGTGQSLVPAAKLGCTEPGDTSFFPITPKQELALVLCRTVVFQGRCHQPAITSFQDQARLVCGVCVSAFPVLQGCPTGASSGMGGSMGTKPRPPFELFCCGKAAPSFSDGLGSLQLSCQPPEAPVAPRSPLGCSGSGLATALL